MEMNITHTPLVLASMTNEPHGPRLAESSISKSIIFFSLRRNQFHLSCPRASAVGKSRADFAKPEKMDMKALMVIPIFHFGIGFPSYFQSTIAIIIMQIALKHQL